MSIERTKNRDFESLSKSGRSAGRGSEDVPSLRPSRTGNLATTTEPSNLININYNYADPAGITNDPVTAVVPDDKQDDAHSTVETGESTVVVLSKNSLSKRAKDTKLLASDRWLVRNGHTLTYFCLYFFSVMVYFRPYEIVPGLQFLSGTAVIFAIATLAVYIPSQIISEGNLTRLSTEVKAIIAMTVVAIITIPIAKSPGLAWETFNDPFIKAVAMFIVMVNVVRTRKRLMGLIWLSLGIGVYLSISAIDLYARGQFSVEEYRVAVDVGGMFGNPNDMAIHFVMFTPIAIVLGIAAKSTFLRLVYFGITGLFIAANMVTFSRGGFIGLIVISGMLAWKIGRKSRLNVTIASLIVGGIALVAAPGNYGLRMLSIFVPALDPVGSSDQRKELLIRSLEVTARNPWGIGIGNFPIVGIRNLQTHNAYTQVSSEIGILGLIAYIVFIVSPLRKLAAIERTLFDKKEIGWFFYMAVGLQASIVGYMVSSFFAPVAYNWFVYYLIAYAVAFRRIYSIENEEGNELVLDRPTVAIA